MADRVNGPLGYSEIPVDDLSRAKAFLSASFGWTFQDMPDGDYTFFDSGEGGIGGGLVVRREAGPEHPIGYVICDDLDATLLRCLAAGGTVVTPRTEFGDAGWLAHITDTEGNLMGLWEAVPG